MNCPPELAPILLALIRTGIVRARASGWSGDAGRAAIEADHVHNLPDLIDSYAEDRLASYWNVEREAYLAEVGRAGAADWQPLWDGLRPFVDRIAATAR